MVYQDVKVSPLRSGALRYGYSLYGIAGGAGFGLGSVPFSVLIGRRVLGKNIREYGDGNPGAFNVFKAGGQKSGYLAIALDVGKGVPWSF